MDQHADSPGHRTYCYAELAVFWILWCSKKITQQMHRQSIWTPPHQDCRCPLFLHRMFFLLPFLLQSSQFIQASDRHQIMLACIPIYVCVRLYRHAWQRHSVTGLLSNSLVRDDVKPVLKLLVLYDLRQYLFKTQTRTHTHTRRRRRGVVVSGVRHERS